MSTSIVIRAFQKSDYPSCAKIYGDGINTGVATFETEVPDWEKWDTKYLKPCRFVAAVNDVVVGWVALTPFSDRAVYSGVAEVTLYISKEFRGQGIGKMLLEHLNTESEAQGFWTLQAKIFPQNSASISLFTNCGFRKVGVRESLGMRDGVWHDNVLLERRKKEEY